MRSEKQGQGQGQGQDDLSYVTMLEEKLISMRAQYDDLFLQYNALRSVVADCTKRLLEFDVQYSIRQRRIAEGGEKID